MVKAPVKPPAPPLVARPALHAVNGAIAVLADIPPPPPAPPGSIPPPPLAPPAAGAGTLLPANQLWPCVHCDAVNEYERDVCKGCGRGFLDALAEPLAELPLVGAIDGSTWAGRLKVGLISLALLVAILIGFTVLGLVLK
jgi:hypothetical protein